MHEDMIVDSGSKFIIDKDTRKITKGDSNLTITQNDHNSERVSISIQRFVDGHDMSTCDRVEVHYKNAGTKDESKGVYVVDDLHVEDDNVLFTWLLSNQTSKYEGKLHFSVRFKCFDGDVIVYDWGTSTYSSIPVTAGCNCDEEPTPEYHDMLESWKQAEIDPELEKKADKETVYTKEEVDQMVTGVYRFCGSTVVLNYVLLATPARVGDVYHIANGGEFTQCASMSIPILEAREETGMKWLYLPRTEYDNIIAMATENDTYAYICIGEKGSDYINAKAVITNIKIFYIDESYMEVTFDFHSNSSIQDVSEIDTENWEITYMDYNTTVETGDNVAWTGQVWDKL